MHPLGYNTVLLSLHGNTKSEVYMCLLAMDLLATCGLLCLVRALKFFLEEHAGDLLFYSCRYFLGNDATVREPYAMYRRKGGTSLPHTQGI